MTTFYPVDQQDLFTARKYELSQLDHLVRALETGPAEHAALFGLRRIGKTLLLREFIRRLLAERPGTLPVFMDFSTLASSPENFSIGYAGLVSHWALNRGEGDAGPFLSASSLPRALLAADGAWLHKHLEPLLQEVEKARPDRQLLLRTAFNLPQEIAREAGVKPILIFDEFQEIRTLTRFPGSENVLQLLRAALQTQTGVLYVLAGSAISVLTHLLSDPESPLFAQFTRIPIEPFDREATGELVRKLTGGKAGHDLLPLIHSLTQGFPFYITAVCRRLMTLIDTAGRPLDDETVKQAFLLETLAPYGRIYEFCRYVYDLSIQKATGYGVLKAVLQMLSGEEGLTASEVARRLKVTPATASDYLRWLREVDLIAERERRYYFRDRVLRYWVGNTVRGVELGPTADTPDLAGLIPRLDAQFQQATEELGRAQESAVRELMRRFDGREADGYLFYVSKPVRLPRFERVAPYRSADGQVELDAVGEFSDREKWIVEVKWRGRRVGVKEVERLADVAREFGARACIVSRSGFTETAVEFAGKNRILLSDREGFHRLQRLFDRGE